MALIESVQTVAVRSRSFRLEVSPGVNALRRRRRSRWPGWSEKRPVPVSQVPASGTDESGADRAVPLARLRLAVSPVVKRAVVAASRWHWVDRSRAVQCEVPASWH